MFQRLLSVGIFVCIGTLVISGHALQQPQKPGPEHQKLQFFVGRWQLEDEDASGGKFNAVSTCEWFEGRFHVICRVEGNGPEGKSRELNVLTYDSGSSEYLWNHIGSLGESASARGRLDGKTWRWHGEPPMKGEQMRYDITWAETSADSYTIKVEASSDKSPSKTVVQGKATRMK
jgi:hypothetical protein